MKVPKVFVLSSEHLRADRLNLLRWAAKVNSNDGASKYNYRIGGVVLLSSEKGRRRRSLKSLCSGEVRHFPEEEDSFEDSEASTEIYEWASDELVGMMEAGVELLIFDLVGPEVIHGLGLDSAIRACLWKAQEEDLDTIFLISAEPSIMDQLPGFYDLSTSGHSEGGLPARYLIEVESMREFVHMFRNMRKRKLRKSMSWKRDQAGSEASVFDEHSATTEQGADLATVAEAERAHAYFGEGPIYNVARFPLLIFSFFVIMMELTGYILVRQMVSLVERIFRSHREDFDRVQKSTSWRSWRRNARQLDIKEGKSGGNLRHLPVLQNHLKALKEATRSFMLESRGRLALLKESENEWNPEDDEDDHASYSSIDTAEKVDDDLPVNFGNSTGIKAAEEYEHELLACLRACTTSMNELVSEVTYAMNNTGSNRETRELVLTYLDALDEVEGCRKPDLLQFRSFNEEPQRDKKEVASRFGLQIGSADVNLRKLISGWSKAINSSGTREHTLPNRLQDGDSETTEDTTDISEEGESRPANHEVIVFNESKRRFFRELSHTFGDTALCLSGGAGNAFYHLGVVKALLQKKLLPKYITGASGGALIGSFICTKTDEELNEFLQQPHKLCKIFDPCGAGFYGMARHLYRHGTIFDKDEWTVKLVNQVCGDLTFAEAYARTGRQLLIPVFNIDAKGKQHTRVLSSRTTPDVVIYSAVLASSALPLLLPPIELLKKDKSGRVVPYHSLGVFWRDGSFQNELPFEALRQLFNVTFTMVSQVEPHLSPFFYNHRGGAGRPVAHGRGRGWRGGFLLSFVERFLKLDLKKWLVLIRDFNLMPNFFKTDVSSIFLGRTRGTVTVVPSIRAFSYMNLISDPDTPQKMINYLNEGMRMAFPSMCMLEDRLEVQRRLNELANKHQS